MGLVVSDVTAWFDSERYGGPEGEGRSLTIRYEGGGGGARGGYLGTAGDVQAGCTLTIITEPDIGGHRSADLTGPGGAPDGSVDMLDLAEFVSYWLQSSHPGGV